MAKNPVGPSTDRAKMRLANEWSFTRIEKQARNIVGHG